MKRIKCVECDEKVDLDDSYRDERGNDLCNVCYREKTFSCAFCEEREWKNREGKIFVVLDAEEARVQTGIYKALFDDYYTQCLIGGGWLHEWAIEKISNLPPDAPKNYDYACGHLCRNCQKKLTSDTPCQPSKP